MFGWKEFWVVGGREKGNVGLGNIGLLEQNSRHLLET